MSRRVWIALFGAIVVVVPLRAQIVVIDPANLTQTILIQERTYQQLDQLRREFEVIQRMAQKLGSLDRYRIPPIFVTGHDPSLWDYGRPWIQALNTGDARGTPVLRNGAPTSASAPDRSESACLRRLGACSKASTPRWGVPGFGGADRCTPSRTGSQLLRQASGRHAGT